VIEAIVENLDVKKSVFQSLEKLVSPDCILATNTSSLSVTAIAAACHKPERFIGIHFFNPAPLMPLVEIIPALQTNTELALSCADLMRQWGKVPVVCKDTPGFIVNRVARPYYSEALRIYDEGIADMATIDAAMRKVGFRMGPFELMDMIGHDVNYTVTESVFAAMYFDPRFRPSITQKKLVEANWLGRKTGRGFYNYAEGAERPNPSSDVELSTAISNRILAMLINEAYDAHYLGVASAEDIDLAMTKGVNYPKGLINWGKEIGLEIISDRLKSLQLQYGEDRYRVSTGIRKA
jgi:3-hydroxybutyryl-CoA dehydrogenase